MNDHHSDSNTQEGGLRGATDDTERPRLRRESALRLDRSQSFDATSRRRNGRATASRNSLSPPRTRSPPRSASNAYCRRSLKQSMSTRQVVTIHRGSLQRAMSGRILINDPNKTNRSMGAREATRATIRGSRKTARIVRKLTNGSRERDLKQEMSRSKSMGDSSYATLQRTSSVSNLPRVSSFSDERGRKGMSARERLQRAASARSGVNASRGGNFSKAYAKKAADPTTTKESNRSPNDPQLCHKHAEDDQSQLGKSDSVLEVEKEKEDAINRTQKKYINGISAWNSIARKSEASPQGKPKPAIASLHESYVQSAAAIRAVLGVNKSSLAPKKLTLSKCAAIEGPRLYWQPEPALSDDSSRRSSWAGAA